MGAKFFLLLGASGVGKTTLIRRLLQDMPTIKYQPSFTTRSKREHEIEGLQYYFVTLEKFVEMDKGGAFLETDQPHGGSFYGITKEPLLSDLKAGYSFVKEVAVKGLLHLQTTQLADFLIPVYLSPESFDDLIIRLVHRDGNKAEHRIRELEVEAKSAAYCKEKIIVKHNDIDFGLNQLKQLINRYI
ncbi:MAG: 50S ribosome-binding GTPase [Bacteroidetes bacterium]|nr:50S ribosome-binding GTPase [Bacteroidota bacterium]